MSNEPPEWKTGTPPSMEPELSAAEVRGYAEYFCWVTLILTPLLIWWNGPAVSSDQFVVRTALIVLAAIGGIGLRTYAIIQKRRQPKGS